MKTKKIAAVIAISAISLPAAAATTTTDFEDFVFARDTANYNLDQEFTGWTALADVIDLGVTQIAGCTTVDTTDYSLLRDFDAETGATLSGTSTKISSSTTPSSADWAAIRADDDFFGHPSRFDLEEQLVYFDSMGFGTNATKHLVLENDVDGNGSGDVALSGVDYDPAEGFVAHGPAVFSDTFNLEPSDTISFDWAADSGGDDYKAFGYLLNVDDCTQIELLDGTGESQAWTTVTKSGVASGTYRFVFIGGTYDQSWGSAAGGDMYLDNVVLPVFIGSNTEPAPYTGPLLQEFSSRTLDVCTPKSITITGARLSDVTASVQGKPVTVLENTATKLVLAFPAGLTPAQDVDLVISSSSGTLTHQDAFDIPADTCETELSKGRWTQLQSDGKTVKMYAKDPIGDGKIQFFVDGKEIAWVNAVDEADPKLSYASSNPYLVRSVELKPGKNRFEIKLDGVRVWRATYVPKG